MEQAYKVLGITELVRQSTAGGVEKFFKHKIQTRGGTIMSVDIGERDFTADKVKPVLTARATEADKILAGP